MSKHVEKHTRYISPMGGVLEFYPSDIKKIADNNEYISKGLSHDQFMVITAKPGTSSNNPAGYLVEVFSPSNGVEPDQPIAQLDIQPNEAFVYYNRRGRKAPELYVLNVPEFLKDRVAWALGGTRKMHEKRTLNELRAHYDMLLTAYVEKGRTDEHTPRRFFYKNFEAVVNFNEDGTADRNNSAYYINGFPTLEDAVEILETAKQYDGWYFSSVAKIDYVLNLIVSKRKSKI